MPKEIPSDRKKGTAVMQANRYKILNTYVDAISMDETIAEVEKIIKACKPTQHVVINAHKVNLMREDPGLRKIVNSCPLINADGASILWAAKKLGVPLKERVAGIDLFENLVRVAARKGYKIYLFGAKEAVVKKTRQVLEQKYPGLQIVGCRNGYFTESEEPEIVKGIHGSGADMMFVAFSSPKKEYWVNKYLEQLDIPFVMGVGGSFDVVAGVTERAPKWMQDIGMEWFYRFIQEPKRLWNRYMVGNRRFIQYTYQCRREMKKEAAKADVERCSTKSVP